MAFFLLCSTLVYRLFDLQIVNGEDYLNNFRLKIVRERSLPSTRGNIYDCNGNLLAYNELAYNITIEDVYEPYLLQEGYIKRSNRGRIATEKAYQTLGIKFYKGIFS